MKKALLLIVLLVLGGLGFHYYMTHREEDTTAADTAAATGADEWVESTTTRVGEQAEISNIRGESNRSVEINAIPAIGKTQHRVNEAAAAKEQEKEDAGEDAP